MVVGYNQKLIHIFRHNDSGTAGRILSAVDLTPYIVTGAGVITDDGYHCRHNLFHHIGDIVLNIGDMRGKSCSVYGHCQGIRTFRPDLGNLFLGKVLRSQLHSVKTSSCKQAEA